MYSTVVNFCCVYLCYINKLNEMKYWWTSLFWT